MTYLEPKLQEYLRNLPALPPATSKIVEICNDPATNPDDLCRVIMLDPILLGRIIKLVNSSYYSLKAEVSTVSKAIIMLGLNTVKNLALSTVIISNLFTTKGYVGLNMEGFWLHSLATGLASKFIAKLGGVDSNLLETYFTAGLLHDIGKVAMNMALNGDYMQAIADADAGKSSLALAEKNDFGIDHTEAGNVLAEAWNLGGLYTTIIRQHHGDGDGSVPNTIDPLSAVKEANYFANKMELGFGGDRRPERRRLSFESYYDDIESFVRSEIDKAAMFLAV
jgi:putative nucleotidyltransferase with HDIG domain